MAEATSSSEVEETGVPPAMPQVLTRNVISMLTRDLDASDVLECYALVRPAPLHGIANSTIHIQKTAIGIRYRPSGAAAVAAQQQHIEKLPIELTLEYGPQRFGPLLHHEAMPYIQVSEEESSFIGWENVGRIFYTTKIVSDNYSSSYYMASMTGAVLNKILIQAVEYAERRRRYQPFAVFSADNGREVRSSSSVDFAQYIWKQLANLGVEIQPILPPPIYEARFWVNSWEKVVPQPSTANEAATFYQNLYKCLEAIATNDYSAYQPTAQPTVSPMPTLMPSISSSPTEEELVTSEPSDDEGDNVSSLLPGDNESESEPDGKSASSVGPLETTVPTSSNTDAQSDEPDTNDDGVDGSDRRGVRARRLADTDDDNDEDLYPDRTDDYVGNDDDTGNPSDEGGSDGDDLIDDDDNIISTEEPSSTALSANPTNTPSRSTISPTAETPQTGQDGVEKVQQAAADAQQAADEAKDAAQTEGENKAADATSNAAAMAAMDGLLSGDGAAMTSIVTTCLTNPQYDIASVDENGTVTVSAFLYRDGSNYYKLNLTSPYLEIAKVNRALPKAVNLSDFGAGGELIDFVLAMLVLSSIFLLVVVLLQQMGYEFFHSLFRCQKWFFNPRKYDYEGNTLDDKENPFSYGEGGIPLSMGGRLTNVSPTIRATQENGNTPRPHSSELGMPELSHQNSGHSMGSSAHREVEMSTLPSSRMRQVFSDNDSNGSLSGDELEVNSGSVPTRRMRDPDLVELPYLKSTSKVAVPVGTSGAHNSNSEMDTQGTEFHHS
jgi:hypothetical protein